MAPLSEPVDGPEVTVVVVSWNTRPLLTRCLETLEPDAHRGTAHVIVVDNDSADDSAQAAQRTAPWAEVLQTGRNLGFGAAINLAARESTTPWLAVANADVALEPGALEALLRCGRSDSGIGAVAPRLILKTGLTQHSVWPLPTVTLALVFALGLHRVIPGLGERLCLEGYWDPERGREVSWAIGAFLLLRRDAFAAMGGFDERQWMYAEDLDLGWRLHDAGWSTRYEPTARVRHADGAATGPAFGEQRRVRFTAASYAVIARQRGLAAAWATAALHLAGTGLRVAWMTPAAMVVKRWREPRRDCVRWMAAHRQGLRGPAAVRRGSPPDDEPVDREKMRRFWNARAREDALYFVDTRRPYRAVDPGRFWDGEPLVDFLLEGLGVELKASHVVLEIGCGVGRITRVLCARSRQVLALDVSDEMLARARRLNPDLDNVCWILGDGISLAGIDSGSLDACLSVVVLQHVPDPAITLGYVRELGRVLRPGGWAALQVSDDPEVHRPRGGIGMRLRALMGQGPRGQHHAAWLGSPTSLPALRRTAGASELDVERVWGGGTQYCQVLLRRRYR